MKKTPIDAFFVLPFVATFIYFIGFLVIRDNDKNVKVAFVFILIASVLFIIIGIKDFFDYTDRYLLWLKFSIIGLGFFILSLFVLFYQ